MSIYTNRKKLFNSMQDTLSKSDCDNITKPTTKPKFNNNILNHSSLPTLKSFHTQTIPFDPLCNQSNKQEIESCQYQKTAFITYVNYSYVEQKKNISNNINNNGSNANISTRTIKPSNRYILSYDSLIKDDDFFSLQVKKQRRFAFPQRQHKLKSFTFCHDINKYNRNYVIKDHTVNYAHDAYKIKKLYTDDNFVNKIKNDLFTLRYSNQLKAFNDL